MVRKNVITRCKAALERGKGQMDTAGDMSFVLRITLFCKSFIYSSKQVWAPTAACQHLRINAGHAVCKELICRERDQLETLEQVEFSNEAGQRKWEHSEGRINYAQSEEGLHRGCSL